MGVEVRTLKAIEIRGFRCPSTSSPLTNLSPAPPPGQAEPLQPNCINVRMLPKKPRASLATMQTQNAAFGRAIKQLHAHRQDGHHSPALHRSPNNKENVPANRGDSEYNFQSHNQWHAYHSQTPSNNCSPILALNRKPKHENPPLFTPHISRKVERSHEGLLTTTCELLMNSKSQHTLSNPFGHLANSSFKGLKQARCNTPSRLQHNFQTCFKKDPALKQSASSINIFHKPAKESLPCSRSLRREVSDPTQHCMNKDGNIAKYKVVDHEEDEQELYYCSQCTIPLVKQGFILEEIGQTNANEEFRAQLQEKRRQVEAHIEELAAVERERTEQMEKYYTMVEQFIQKQRKNDTAAIAQKFGQLKNNPKLILHRIDQLLANLHSHQIHPQQISTLLSLPELPSQPAPTAPKATVLFDCSQTHFQQFTASIFPSEKSSELICSKANALRFSFQRLLTDINTKKGNLHTMMSLEEEEEEPDTAPSKQRTAFRNLFPDQEDYGSAVLSPTFKNI